ncbi:GspE/PulE family protein [Maricaulis sp.]|uniref:GspE/PulE family protein n=1 Tax=Maricaulis sp. TaxID=1486257 RepID=UPI002B26F49B|nr:GspE/PulE family protein [Maricaulis sp.]
MTNTLNPSDTSRLDRMVAAGLLTQAESGHAAALQRQTREPLDRVLAQAGLATEQRIAQFFSSECDTPLAALSDGSGGPDSPRLEAVFGRINPLFLQSERIWPIALDGEKLVAGIVDPSNRDAVDGLEFATGLGVRSVVLTQTQFETCSGSARSPAAEMSDQTDLDLAADTERLRDMATAGPVIRQLDNMISAASRSRASDIHIELKQRDAKIRFRVDGLLRDIETWGLAQALAVISRVKVLADLDITERRRPQDGRFSVPVSGHSLDLRVSVVPGQYGESLVLRLLDTSTSLNSLADLGMSEAVAAVADKALTKPHGLILVTGPTGSGKTTTLYAFLRQLATAERKILTIEDPIEYRLNGIAQSQTNTAIGVTFSSALRAFLRHDPDVVMVGEIRDGETARTAVQAAMTGHLVLSTLHTNDAESAVLRLRDMGVEDYLIAATLVAAFGQRLIRRTCESCRGSGCGPCQSTGFSGRAAITEGFLVDDPIRSAIRSDNPEAELTSALAQGGYTRMWADGLAKVESGLTTKDELTRTLSDLDVTRYSTDHDR